MHAGAPAEEKAPRGWRSWPEAYKPGPSFFLSDWDPWVSIIHSTSHSSWLSCCFCSAPGGSRRSAARWEAGCASSRTRSAARENSRRCTQPSHNRNRSQSRNRPRCSPPHPRFRRRRRLRSRRVASSQVVATDPPRWSRPTLTGGGDWCTRAGSNRTARGQAQPLDGSGLRQTTSRVRRPRRGGAEWETAHWSVFPFLGLVIPPR